MDDLSASNPVLPIEGEHGFFCDAIKAREIGEQFSSGYKQANPFPHIKLDHFLPAPMANELLAHFPAAPSDQDKVYRRGYGGQHKRQISPGNCDASIRNAFSFFNSAPMLQFLEGLTGIKGLIPDPYFSGGGLHEIRKGGFLGIHADFRVNESMQLVRRINVLIYLNKDWQDHYGGQLELWDAEMTGVVESVAPVFNRCVVFNTDEHSFHGHPEPLRTPTEVSRKSIALYYYTASEIENTSGESRQTRYVARPNDSRRNRATVRKLERKRMERAAGIRRQSLAKRLKSWWSSQR